MVSLQSGLRYDGGRYTWHTRRMNEIKGFILILNRATKKQNCERRADYLPTPLGHLVIPSATTIPALERTPS